MFQLDWYDENLYIEDNLNIDNSYVNLTKKEEIETIGLTFWAEHCLECAPPECYKNCNYYNKRPDSRCRRTQYGLKQVKTDKTILGYSIRFRYLPWAKLETKIFSRSMSIKEYSNLANKYENAVKIINNKLSMINPNRILNSIGYFVITRVLTRFPSEKFLPDLFVLQLYSHENVSYNMLIESVDKDGKVLYRTSVIINPAFNSYKISYKELCPLHETPLVLRMYPENNIQAALDLYMADFIKLKHSANDRHIMPAQKIKCVAWDLDNTIWQGVLSETDDSIMMLKDGVAEMLEALDKRGILQTIVSKNDFKFAWPLLEKLGISKYFLYPAINWGQKSKNLEQISNELNINIDTFAMIDDSLFERAEIQSTLPQVRVYDENNLLQLLLLKEFDVPITEESSKRREMYKVEEKRKEILSFYDGNYLDFIRSCDMKIDICTLESVERKKRCLELIQRTNQLNLTGQKYSEKEFQNMINDSNRINLSINCSDKFGDYGTVGFLSILINKDIIMVSEMAISCRVAQKHVEYTILSWVCRNIVLPKGFSILLVNYQETPKNRPIFKVLDDIGFNMNSLSLDARKIEDYDKIININENILNENIKL
jgi:HAD-superfamily phosphatase, subfamily IIIC/FkbH-like domain